MVEGYRTMHILAYAAEHLNQFYGNISGNRSYVWVSVNWET